MSIRSIDYTGAPTPMGSLIQTPLQAAHAIKNGYIPENLVYFSNQSEPFRDATLSELLTLAANENAFEQVLDTLCSAMRSASDNSVTLRVMSEYTAAIAFAWEHQDLAGKVIMRNTPQNTSPFLWSLVSAIKKNVPSAMYAGLLLSMGADAMQKWQTDALLLFGLTVPATATI